MRRILFGCAMVVCGLGGVCGSAVAAAPSASAARAAQTGPVASTTDGRVRGVVSGATDEFLGIPYAKPPVGRLRWRAPQKPDKWSQVKAATKLPPRCPQLKNGNGPRSTDENCLDVSVYRPHGTTSSSALPVMFWIHGGGLTTGSGDQHNGSLLADTNHIEVVSINYRLGIFGFLALPSLSREASDHASGDYGLLDQEAALRWTHDNIRSFGGDPSKVTIAGESAGGYSVCSLLTSPTIRGLFSSAIIQSGSCASQPQSAAIKSGVAFARAAGCRDAATAADCLRDRPASDLLNNKQYPSGEVPVVGGAELPVAPAAMVAKGSFAHVPVLIGTNHDEGRTFAQGEAKVPESGYVKQIHQDYGASADQVLAQYPWSSYPAPYETAYALGAVWTDSGFVAGIGGCSEQNLAGELSARTPTYFYEFSDEQAPGLNRTVPGYQWGAGHAMELAYMWPSFDNGYSLYDLFTPAQHELSDQMVRWWGAFVTSGNPAVAGQATWPSYDTGQLMSLQEGDASTAIPIGDFAGEHKCPFWDSLPGQPSS